METSFLKRRDKNHKVEKRRAKSPLASTMRARTPNSLSNTVAAGYLDFFCW